MFAASRADCTWQGFYKGSIIRIIELLSYAVIGIAAFLVVGTVIFLSAINIGERIDVWRVERAVRKHKGPR